MVAALAVNVPGFPVTRPRALVAAGDEGEPVLTLVAAGIHDGTARVGAADRERLRALGARARGEVAELARRARDGA